MDSTRVVRCLGQSWPGVITTMVLTEAMNADDMPQGTVWMEARDRQVWNPQV